MRHGANQGCPPELELRHRRPPWIGAATLATPPSAWDRGDNLLEKFWVEMKRQATIPDPMLMTTFKASSRIAEHEGTRHEGCSAIRSPVLESAPCDGGHAYQIVLLFEAGLEDRQNR
jgi:hypothetical protein